MISKFFIFSVLLIFFSYFVFRIVVRKDYLKKQKLSPLSYLLETLVFALHANFSYVFLPVGWPGLPVLPENPIILFLSFFFIIPGLILLLISWFKLGTTESFGQDRNSLRISGIYRYSRNPQLLGYGLFLLGFMILYISWYSIVWFLLYLIISWFMVLSEEEFLLKKYQKAYIDYCKSVPRIFKFF